MAVHPNSLRNLKRGGCSPDPRVRQHRARKAGMARARKAMSAIELQVFRDLGFNGLEGFRRAMQLMKNRAYQAKRKAAKAA